MEKIVNIITKKKAKSNISNIAKSKNCYLRITENEDIVISNFVVVPLFSVFTKDWTEYHVLLKNNEHESEHIFLTSDLSSKKKFKESISKKFAQFSFTGNDNDIEFIKVIMSKETEVKKIGIDYTGIFKNGDDWDYIDKNGCFLNSNYVISSQVENDITYNLKNLINHDEIKEISNFLFEFNIPEVTYTTLSTMASFFLKSKLMKNKIKTPHLSIFGESGSGKSETLDNILNSFFQNIKTETAAGCKKFGLTKKNSESTIVPTVIEEYKDYKLNDTQKNLISEFLRSVYDCQGFTRGRPSQTSSYYEYRAPIIIVGETQISETAFKDRTNQVIFSKLYHNESNLSSFIKLKSNRHLLEKLSNNLLLKAIEIDEDYLLNKYSEFMDMIPKGGFTDRIKNNIAVAMLGYDLICNVFNDFGIKLKNYDEVMNILLNAQKDFNMCGDGKIKSVVDSTLENIKIMIDMGILVENVDYVMKDFNFCFKLGQLYTKLTKYRRDYNVKDEICDTKSSFLQQLEKTKCFVAKNKLIRSFWGIGNDSKTERCVIINTLELLNIEFICDEIIDHDEYIKNERVAIESN